MELNPRPMLPIDGNVDFTRTDAIVLNVGTHEGVQIGYEFTIYRDDTFVGKVRVTKAFTYQAETRVIYAEKPIKVGDRASTRVGV